MTRGHADDLPFESTLARNYGIVGSTLVFSKLLTQKKSGTRPCILISLNDYNSSANYFYSRALWHDSSLFLNFVSIPLISKIRVSRSL